MDSRWTYSLLPVGMMHDPFGPALSQRHVQRPEHQFGAKMMGHRPSHHPAAEHVEHDRQIHEPRPGRHVGDVGHPDSVRPIGLELAFDPVRDRTMARVHARSARAPQRLLALRTKRTPTASPRVVPAGGDAQHPAHRGHPMMGLIRLHVLEDFARTEPVSRANQAVAFASISRSSRS